MDTQINWTKTAIGYKSADGRFSIHRPDRGQGKWALLDHGNLDTNGYPTYTSAKSFRSAKSSAAAAARPGWARGDLDHTLSALNLAVPSRIVEGRGDED